MKHRILSHTADLRLEVFGKTIEELFQNATEALARILRNKKLGIRNYEFKEKIIIKSTNINTLLVDFLNEILAKSNINKRIYKVHKIIKLEENYIEAEILGFKIDQFDEDVKAVTYHEADIKKENATWSTKLVFDI